MGKNKFWAKLGLCVLSAVLGAAAFASCADNDGDGSGGNKNGVTSADDNVKFEDVTSERLLNAVAWKAAFDLEKYANFSMKMEIKGTENGDVNADKTEMNRLYKYTGDKAYLLGCKKNCVNGESERREMYFAKTNGEWNAYGYTYINAEKTFEGVCDMSDSQEYGYIVDGGFGTGYIRLFGADISFSEVSYSTAKKGYIWLKDNSEVVLKFVDGLFAGCAISEAEEENSNTSNDDSSISIYLGERTVVYYNIGCTQISLPAEMNGTTGTGDEEADFDKIVSEKMPNEAAWNAAFDSKKYGDNFTVKYIEGERVNGQITWEDVHYAKLSKDKVFAKKERKQKNTMEIEKTEQYAEKINGSWNSWRVNSDGTYEKLDDKNPLEDLKEDSIDELDTTMLNDLPYRCAKYDETKKCYILTPDDPEAAEEISYVIVKFVNGLFAGYKAEAKSGYYSSMQYSDVGTTKVDRPAWMANVPVDKSEAISKEEFFAELEKREAASIAAKKWGAVNVRHSVNQKGDDVENITKENLKIVHGQVASEVSFENENNAQITYEVFRYSLRKSEDWNVDMPIAKKEAKYWKNGEQLKAEWKVTAGGIQIIETVTFDADGYVTEYKYSVYNSNGSDCVLTKKAIFSGYSGEYNFPSGGSESGEKEESNGMETPEIVDSYTSLENILSKAARIIGEEMSETEWKNAFDESLYSNVSVNLFGLDNRDGCASVMRYYKAGDRGYFDMTSFEHNFDYGINEAYYVRKNGNKTEYLSALHSSPKNYTGLNDWQWNTIDKMKNPPETAWSWNCFGYLALGGLENQYSAFTYNAETGEYTASNLSVIFGGETVTMEKVLVKFKDGKVAAMYCDGWAYPLYIVFSDFGTTIASAFEQVSAENWGQAFDKILENRDFYMNVQDGSGIKERWHISGDLADVENTSYEEIHYYDIQNGIVYEEEITGGTWTKVAQPETVASVLEKLFGKVAESYSAFSYDEGSKMYVCNNFTANGKTETVRVKLVGGYVRYIEFESKGEGGAKEIRGYAFYSYNDMIVPAKKMA